MLIWVFIQIQIGIKIQNICEKRTPEVQRSIERAQHLPQISYISDLSPILKLIRIHGQVAVDGVAKIPATVKMYYLNDLLLV